jgi:hemerythrin superfamily protein
MDAIDLLERHHRQLEQRFSALKESDRPSIEDFKAASDLLVSHITIEEQQFYPAVQARRTEDILLESLEEHLSLKRVLSDLLALATDDPQFSPKLHVLAEQLEHHHKEEEDHLFPRVKKLLDAEAREAARRPHAGAARADEASRPPASWSTTRPTPRRPCPACRDRGP